MSDGRHAKHGDLINDAHYRTPIYRKAEAARIVRVPPTTLRSWAGPSPFFQPAEHRAVRLSDLPKPDSKSADMSRRVRYQLAPEPLITTAEPPTPRGPTVPFVGLAEAYILAAFRGAGVPMQRIRPAIERLEEQIGLRQALASERLKTDGAEVLWDYGQLTDSPAEKTAVGDLVVVRNGQLVFREIVQGYLRKVTYEHGWARIISVGHTKVDIIVDPWVNGGLPTLARRGITVADVMSRIRAGESEKMVALDYDLEPSELAAALEQAA